MGARNFDDPDLAGTTLGQPGEDSLRQIVVKLHDNVELTSPSEVGDYLKDAFQSKFAAATPFKQVRRLINPENREIVQELMARAEKEDPTYRPRNLLNYYTLVVSPEADFIGLKTFLLSLSVVETAYLDQRGENPQVEPRVDPKDDPEFSGQGYLQPAPDGVGAVLVWPNSNGTGVKGGDGVGVSLIDMELGWTLDHEDLGTKGSTPLYGKIKDLGRPHGTAVLGIISGRDNDRGIVGIVPNIASVRVVSYEAHDQKDRANAILVASHNLKYGDVLLLEAQLFGLIPTPIEVLSHDFDVIRLATAAGIIVIEAAANNNHTGTNLDTFKDDSGQFILNPAAPGFKDSGAILVGAASAGSTHTKLQTSNFV
jgi:serine protease